MLRISGVVHRYQGFDEYLNVRWCTFLIKRGIDMNDQEKQRAVDILNKIMELELAEGFATFQRFQESLARGEIPAYEMIEGPIILVGGALLLTPGFITDIIGFACLIPQLRRKIAQFVIENYLVQAGAHFQQGKAAENNVLEGEFRKEE